MKFSAQIENDALNIHDNDRTTEGGPPGWLTFTITALLYFIVIGIAVLLLCLFAILPS